MTSRRRGLSAKREHRVGRVESGSIVNRSLTIPQLDSQSSLTDHPLPSSGAVGSPADLRLSASAAPLDLLER